MRTGSRVFAAPRATTTPRSALPGVAALSMRKSCWRPRSAHMGRVSAPTRRSLVCTAGDAGAAAADSVDETPYDALDIRVGKITKAWKHPDADKLYIEEVDMGEEEVRTICSGLVGFVEEAELQERGVLVLANLKPRNMAGVKSNGMLLAASDADHTTVQLLTPPEGAAPGERVRFGDLEAAQRDADTPNRVQKKKLWEAVQPELNTSADCVVQYKDKAMLTSAGPVTVASLTGATVG